jgi:hypothetical protein
VYAPHPLTNVDGHMLANRHAQSLLPGISVINWKWWKHVAYLYLGDGGEIVHELL